MPWVHVREPYAAPPRLVEPGATRAFDVDDVDVVRDCAHVADVVVEDLEALRHHIELDLDSVIVRQVTLGDDGPEVDASRTTFESCDLSRARFRHLRQSRIVDSKLTGTDFSGTQLTDVVFERCLLHLTQFRMAKMQRVAFVDCRLREVDAFELTAEDVRFDGSELERVNIDRLRASRVDMRGATALSFEGVGRLTGCIVAESQLLALAHELAFAVGLDVERLADDTADADMG